MSSLILPKRTYPLILIQQGRRTPFRVHTVRDKFPVPKETYHIVF